MTWLNLEKINVELLGLFYCGTILHRNDLIPVESFRNNISRRPTTNAPNGRRIREASTSPAFLQSLEINKRDRRLKVT